MCPSSHSSCSRTSTQAAPSSSCASRASTSSISVLDLLEKFPVGRHCFTNDSSRSAHSRCRLPVPRRVGACRRASVYVAVAVAALAAAGVVVGLTLDTRTTPHQPQAAAGKPPVRGPAGPGAAADRGGVQDWPHGSIDDDAAARAPSTSAARRRARERSAVVQYYRGIALLWAGYPARRDDRARAGEEARPRHDHPEPGRQPAPPGVLPAGSRPRLPGLRADAAEPAARAGLAAPARRATRSPPSALYQRAARAAARTTSRRRSPPRSASSTRTTSTPRSRTSARSSALPAQPDRPLLPRAAARLDGAGARRRSTQFKQTRQARAERPSSARQADEFLARHRAEREAAA